MSKLTEEDKGKILLLHSEGKSDNAISKELKIAYHLVHRFLEKVRSEKEGGEGKRGAPAGLKAEKVAEKVASDKFVELTKTEATEVSSDIVGLGSFVYENYTSIARSRGLEVSEYLAMATKFYENYKDMIAKLEEEKKSQEEIIKKLTEYLEPIPYRFEALITMMKAGKIYTRKEFDSFLWGGDAGEE
ncbi:MAG: hypothetical protein AB1779_00865 [Candidatus Thermoplasmatota archaeon]